MRFKRLCVVVVLLLAACGGDDAGSGGDKDATPQAEATTAESGSQTADPECRKYANAFAGITPDPANPTSFSNFKQVADSMDQVAGKVPNEVSDDFGTVASAYRNFAEGAGNLDPSDPDSVSKATPEDLQRMQDSLKALDTEQVRKAVANIEAFVKEHCPQG